MYGPVDMAAQNAFHLWVARDDGPEGVSVAPSPAHQIVLDLREDAPSAFNLEPAAGHLHVWYEGTGLVTHTIYIGEYPGPYSYDEKYKLP